MTHTTHVVHDGLIMRSACRDHAKQTLVREEVVQSHQAAHYALRYACIGPRGQGQEELVHDVIGQCEKNLPEGFQESRDEMLRSVGQLIEFFASVKKTTARSVVENVAGSICAGAFHRDRTQQRRGTYR